MTDPRTRLLAVREEALAQLAGLGVSRDQMVAAADGANADDEHDPEGATIAFERELLQALIVQAKGRIAEVDAALDRLADGSYGICEVCREPINPERLAVRPIASRCLTHA